MTICNKPTDNIILNSKNLKSFPFEIRHKAIMPCFNTILRKYSLEVLAALIRQEKLSKGSKFDKKEFKTLLFINDMINIKDPKGYTENS